MNSCQSKTKVSLTAVWTLPYSLSNYQISARAYSGVTGVTLATASTVLTTVNAGPCTPMISETITTGYWGIYPAIWLASNAQNCLIPGTRTYLRITDRSSGSVVYETTSPLMSWMLGYEGAVVPYSSDFQVEAELHSSTGAVLARSVQFVTSAPLR